MENVPDSPAARELISAFALLMKKIEQRPRLAAALADPKTSSEAFYSLMFGDVETMLDRVAAIEQFIADAGNKLNMQTSQLIDAGNRHEKLLAALFDEGKRNIARSAESSKVEQLRSIQDAMQGAASSALEAAISERMGKVLSDLAKANKELSGTVTLAKAAATSIEAKSKRWLWIAPVGAVMAAAILAVAVFVANTWSTAPGGQGGAHLTVEQQRLIRAGQDFEKALPKLDPKTQAKIQTAINQP